jgi:hypothetical protein
MVARVNIIGSLGVAIVRRFYPRNLALAKFAAIRLRTSKIGAIQYCVLETRGLNMGAFECRAVQIRTREISAFDVTTVEPDPSEICRA